MMRTGWSPTRRNRNIGTAKSGHGLANSLVIPESRSDPRPFWEKLRDPVGIESNGFTILVEPCASGLVYAVTVDDIVRMLGLLPVEDFAALRTIVLRRPTRKQRVLSAVWGRLVYVADLGETKGPAVILEAQPPDACVRWSRSLTPDDAEEVERLRGDGHVVSGDRRKRIQTSLTSTRSTQLFRTLPHEIGHYVHYLREVEQPAGDDFDEWLRLNDRYFSKPVREKEDFAHRYAREIGERLSSAGSIPYPRIVDAGNMKRWRLDPRWFGVA